MSNCMYNSSGKSDLTKDEQLDMMRGKFFCTLADVWEIGSKNSIPDHWKAFWRNQKRSSKVKLLSINVRKKQEANKSFDPYKLTRDAIETGQSPAPVKSTRSESDSAADNKKAIWPVDIVGEDALSERHQIAHLLPAGKQNHEEWFGVGAAVVGLPQNATTLEQLMATRGVARTIEDVEDVEDAALPTRAVAVSPSKKRGREEGSHGGSSAAAQKKGRQTRRSSKDRAAQKKGHQTAAPPVLSQTVAPTELRRSSRARKPAARENLLERTALKGNYKPSDRKQKKMVSFDERSLTSSRAREILQKFTGAVHFVSNKIRMMGQEFLFDGRKPRMMVIPCMSLKNATEWRGEGYKAVVLPGLPHGLSYVPDEYKDLKYETLPFKAFKEAGMDDDSFIERFLGSPQIAPAEANQCLSEARSGLEDAVLGLCEYVKGMPKRDLDCLQKTSRDALEARSEKFIGMSSFPIPKQRSIAPEKPILIIEFGSQEERGKHPAPDPELLLARAATVWGNMNDLQLLAAGEDDDEDDESESLDRMAEEAYCEQFLCSAPKIPTEISVVTPGAVLWST